MKKFWYFSFLSFFVLVFATACKQEEQPLNVDSQSVSCYFITDEGAPISDAAVYATDGEGKLFSTSTTNELGSFEVNNIPTNTDNAIVSFVKNGIVIKQLKLGTLLKIAKKGDNILLGDQYDYDAVFAVKVVDASSDEVIENALVTLYTSNQAKFEANTNTDGYAYFPSIVPGRYNIYITHSDYNYYGESLLLLFPDGMDTVSFTFPLAKKSKYDTTGGGHDSDLYCCNNSIKIKTYMKTNTGTVPYIGKIKITNSNGQLEFKDTDANGDVEFTDLCSGRIHIEVADSNYYGYIDHNYEKNTILVFCDNRLEESMLVEKASTKCCNNVLVVNYLDKNGNALTCVTKASITESNWSQTVNVSNGTAVFTGLCNGKTHTYNTTVQCANANYDYNYISAEFTCKDTVIAFIKMHQFKDTNCFGAITIILRDSTTNKHIDVATGDIKGGPNNISQPLTFAKGIAKLDGLCEGTYNIYVNTECGEQSLRVVLDAYQHKEEVLYFVCP